MSVQNIPVYNYFIQVTFHRGIVQIENNTALQGLMKDYARTGVPLLVTEIYKKYQEMWGTPLNIKRHSLELEIWGHYYFEKIFGGVKFIFRKMGWHRIKRRLTQATADFDCGEKDKDSNRWFWDLYSIFYPLLILPFRDKKKR